MLAACLLLGVGGGLSACSSAAPESVRPTQTQTADSTVADPTVLTLNCNESFPVGAQQATALGAVALETRRVLQTVPSNEGVPEARLFAKTGLLVRAAASVDLALVDEPGGPTMGWGGSAPRARRVHVPACPAVGDAAWLAWPGGFWVGQPGCVPVTVTAGDRRAVVQMSVGRACP